MINISCFRQGSWTHGASFFHNHHLLDDYFTASADNYNVSFSWLEKVIQILIIKCFVFVYVITFSWLDDDKNDDDDNDNIDDDNIGNGDLWQYLISSFLGWMTMTIFDKKQQKNCSHDRKLFFWVG